MLLYLSLGSNLGAREQLLKQAIQALGEKDIRLLKCSSFYETEPVGFCSDKRFLNCAAVFDTHLAPQSLLDITQEIERRLGRTEKSQNGCHTDRPIDIDLLLYGETVVASAPQLILPHPRMHERRFVLEPLAEIAPEALHPLLGRTAAQLLAELNRPHIRPLAEASAENLEAINRLLPQLSASTKPLTAEALAALVKNPGTYVYVLADETQAVRAMATLCLASSPTGTKAWIEDVVVDAAARRRGYARALLGHLKAESRRLGAKSLNLTSRPGREAANRLYRTEGFALRETNVYRF